MINDVLWKHLNKFIIVYFNDILIYSETLEEYKKYVYIIL
jgi:hypothetical protein